jgi:molybdopterin-guanine dinucleotide biosynthesis protein A
MLPEPIVALVLAGGAARRMGGGDKPLLPIQDQPMLARIITALEPLSIAISANGDPSRFAAFGRPVLTDGPFAGQGPLAGVLAGLDWAIDRGAAALLTTPGDIPFLPADLAAALSPAPACAASAGRTHHLIALWPVACRSALHAMLAAAGSRAVARFANQIGTRIVEFPVHAFDSFLNVNTPEELAIARAHAATVSARTQEGE